MKRLYLIGLLAAALAGCETYDARQHFIDTCCDPMAMERMADMDPLLLDPVLSPLPSQNVFLFGGPLKRPAFVNDRMIWGATDEPIYILK